MYKCIFVLFCFVYIKFIWQLLFFIIIDFAQIFYVYNLDFDKLECVIIIITN